MARNLFTTTFQCSWEIGSYLDIDKVTILHNGRKQPIQYCQLCIGFTRENHQHIIHASHKMQNVKEEYKCRNMQAINLISSLNTAIDVMMSEAVLFVVFMHATSIQIFTVTHSCLTPSQVVHSCYMTELVPGILTYCWQTVRFSTSRNTRPPSAPRVPNVQNLQIHSLFCQTTSMTSRSDAVISETAIVI